MDDLAGQFRQLRDWARGNSALYEQLCETVVDDPDLLELADVVPADRWPPHVFLSAVHRLVLDGTDHELAAYYASVTDDPRPPDAELSAAFRDFCLGHADRLRPMLERRRTQTNAVRRCAALYPAITTVAREAGDPLALVELGPSAGLNLLFDRYRYDYGEAGVVGADDDAVAMSTEVRSGDPPLPDDPPAVASRVGVDLHPLDVTDSDDADWLRALTWPGHVDRRRLLDAALSVAREDPPRLVAGDFVDRLPEVVAEIPRDRPVCVFNTLVLYQLPDDARDAAEAELRELAAERPLHWLSGDHGREADGDAEALDLTWMRAVDGAVRTDRLGRFQPHGEWIEWRASGNESVRR